jgi:hypothetical protein
MGIPRPPPLTVAQQYFMLRSNPICAGAGNVQRGRLTWEYEAQPTLLSRTYTIRIAYQLGERPQIVVRHPDLVELAGPRRLPHVYQQDPPLLCLYRTVKGEWTQRMRLDETIVPWTALWLFYFEEWLVSNEWKGGGEHPGETDKPRRDLERAER